jgi:two-component SAPR family response regulator
VSRIFIVEDEALIAMLIEDMLEELEHEVIGSAQRLDEAMTMARSIECDLAILDINLNGKMSSPVAGILRERSIPFFFASGYGRSGLDENFAESAVLAKPFGLNQMDQAIRKVLDKGAQIREV